MSRLEWSKKKENRHFSQGHIKHNKGVYVCVRISPIYLRTYAKIILDDNVTFLIAAKPQNGAPHTHTHTQSNTHTQTTRHPVHFFLPKQYTIIGK